MRHLLTALVLPLAVLGLCCVSFGPPSTDEAFEGRPSPREGVYRTSMGTHIATGEVGNPEGPLVLFVHGSPGSWNDFGFVMADPELAERAFVVSVDRLGWGGSAECGLVSSMSEQALGLLAVLEAHPENLPAVVVGHSLGGPVAARLAMDAPEHVAALVLVAASVDPALEEMTWYQSLARTWLVRPIVPDFLAQADDEIGPLRGELEAMLPLWSRLRMPTYVLHGEDDALVPVANAEFIERVLVHGPLSIERIPDQGHLIPWQCPERIVATVLGALEGR